MDKKLVEEWSLKYPAYAESGYSTFEFLQDFMKECITQGVGKKIGVDDKLVEEIIAAIITPLDDYDVDEEQRLSAQVTNDMRDEVKRILTKWGREWKKIKQL